MVGAERQHGIGHDRKEAPSRDQTVTHNGSVYGDSGAEKNEPAGTKSLNQKRAGRTFRRWQAPGAIPRRLSGTIPIRKDRHDDQDFYPNRFSADNSALLLINHQ